MMKVWQKFDDSSIARHIHPQQYKKHCSRNCRKRTCSAIMSLNPMQIKSTNHHYSPDKSPVSLHPPCPGHANQADRPEQPFATVSLRNPCLLQTPSSFSLANARPVLLICLVSRSKFQLSQLRLKNCQMRMNFVSIIRISM